MASALIAAAEADTLGAATINEIAAALNVSRTSVYDWAAQHKEFADAIAHARKIADKKVESALFKRALGYELQEVRKTVKDGPKGVEVIEHTQVNHIPADTPAAVFWLKNRNREEWSDKQQLEVTGDFFEHVERIVKGEA